jgi:flagellar basal body P-ring formation protein FlgA
MSILLAGNPAFAASLQSHDSIKAAAEEFISAAVEASHGLVPTVSAGGLDSRLRLSNCDQPLEAFLPTGGKLLGNITVGVRCSGTRPWSLYVPVRVALFSQVVVAARPLTRNSVLTQEDMKLEKRDLAQLQNGYFTDPSALIGKKVGRNIAMNAALDASRVRDPLAVKRGQRVNLVAAANGIEVRMKGEAMSDGATGDRIKVRNLSSKRVVDGVIESSSTIQVAM